MSWLELLLIPLGFAVGAYGTMIGGGGGFVLVPALLLLFPNDSQSEITAVSLAVILATSASGAVANAYRRVIDFQTGLLLASAMVPASFAGAYAVRFLPRSLFDISFGFLLVALAIFSVVGLLEGGRAIREPRPRKGVLVARTIDRGDGVTSQYSYDVRQGMGLSAATGFVATLFGVGGGIIQVPLMATFLRIPLDISVATAQFMVIFMAAAGASIHAASGDFGSTGLIRAGLLSIGAIVGAQAGAFVSPRLTNKTIVRLLSGGLITIGVGLILSPLV